MDRETLAEKIEAIDDDWQENRHKENFYLIVADWILKNFTKKTTQEKNGVYIVDEKGQGEFSPTIPELPEEIKVVTDEVGVKLNGVIAYLKAMKTV